MALFLYKNMLHFSLYGLPNIDENISYRFSHKLYTWAILSASPRRGATRCKPVHFDSL